MRRIITITTLLAALLAALLAPPAVAQTCDDSLCRNVIVLLANKTLTCVPCGPVAQCF